MRTHWSDSDEFWEKTYPFEFNDRRFKAAAAEVSNLLRLTAVPPAARILDLCCGPGRHSIELSKRGYEVTGVDRTAFYIEIARESAARENLNIDFQVGDARSFVRRDQFDLVLNLWTSFGYFDTEADDLALLKNAYASLRHGGQFIIETLNSDTIVNSPYSKDRREHDGNLLLEESTVSRDKKTLATRWTLIANTGQKSEFDFSLRLYSMNELVVLLGKAGFGQVAKYGDFDGRPFTEQSTRMLIIATK